MERYNGKWLGASPNIVVIGSCKVGNFVVTIPLLAELRKKYPKGKIGFWGSEITKDFEDHLCNYEYKNIGKIIDWRESWDNNSEEDRKSIIKAIRGKEGIDYVINCDGFNPITQKLAKLLQ